MPTIGARIKEIRKSENLTQQEFADKLGISRANIANYEKDLRTPIEAALVLICDKYNINRKWLETGEGKKERPVSRDAEIASFMGNVMRGESDDFRRRLVAVLAKLDASEWELLEKMALKLAVECKKEDQA